MYVLHYTDRNFKGKTVSKELLLPQGWEEMSGEQLIQLMKIRKASLDEQQYRLRSLAVMMKLTTYKFLRLPLQLIHELTHEQGTQTHLTNWYFRKNTLTMQLLPEYGGLYGPRGELDNLVMKEWHYADMCYEEIKGDDGRRTTDDGLEPRLKDGQAQRQGGTEGHEGEEALNKLVAALYRPAKEGYDAARDPDGDIRVPFNANEVAYYSNQVAQWPMEVRMAVFYWYEGCCQMLLNRYEPVFSGGEPRDEDDAPGMFAMMRGLSGTKYGDFEKVENLNIHTALMEMEMLVKEAEEMESRMK